MFVEGVVIIPRPVEEVTAGLSSGGVRLLGESLAEVGEDVVLLRSRVGPGRSGAMLAKTVEIQPGPTRRHGDTTLLAFTWRPTGVLPLFPELDADLEVRPAGLERTQLTLRGRYAPPGGSVGRGMDRLVLHRIAEATIRAFLADLAKRLDQREPPPPCGRSVPG
ncbi:MAG: SRPBCC family protein [Actinomycetota bacterium]|nr:SRPBCC family protein [Actinomycetota bacterium]